MLSLRSSSSLENGIKKISNFFEFRFLERVVGVSIFVNMRPIFYSHYSYSHFPEFLPKNSSFLLKYVKLYCF